MTEPEYLSHRLKRYLRVFLESLHGKERDYTQGPVSKAVILLGIPMVLEMVMESVFAVTDIFVVGRLGPRAIATVGLTESLITIVYTVAFGLSIGASATVARRIGEKDEEGAADAAVQSLALGVLVSILVGIIGVAFAPDLLTLMGADAATVAYATPYMRVMFGGNISILLLFLANAVFRGAGDSAIAMRAMWIANGINVILAPCLVYGWGFFPELGVTGAACATTLSRGIGAAYTISHLARGQGRVKVHKRHLRLHPDVMWKLMKLSGSGTFQMFIGMASWIGLVRVISTFGSEAIAGYTVTMRIVLFALFPAFGLGNAAATMVGQSLGAGKPDRAEKSVWVAGLYNLAFLGTMGLVFLVFAPVIVGWFSNDPTVDRIAIHGLRTIASGFFFYSFGMVISQSFNGAGDTWTPTWINFFVFWMLEVPLAYVLAKHAGMGPEGVFLAVMIAFSAYALVSTLVFRRGNWKKTVV